MDYHEEILGAWQSRQILATTYHAVSGPSDSPAEEATYCLLSCEDPGKEFRPFLMVMKDEGGIRSFGYKLKKSSSGQITGLSANWLYSGSGVGWVDADFKLTPDGPRLVKIANGGRHAPVTTRTYNAAGKVIRKTVEQLDP
ncbi:MAG: hypothetical protein JWO82_2086 [Akkermansiaceae bacterium]|nr:hypothetical protein [Akkermansiaceae bacterium]